MEVKTNRSPQVGRAIFGTERGLVAQGSGVLADAPVSIFEFDVGRQRDGLLHKMKPGDHSLFFRRLEEKSTGNEVDLIGLVAPCLDAHERRGFMGACVAMPLDSRHRTDGFSDWRSIQLTLNDLFEDVLSLLQENSKKLLWRRVLDSSTTDRKMRWITVLGRTLFLHAGDETDAQIIRSMQAMAFKFGSDYSTILAFHTSTKQSVPLSHPDVAAALSDFEVAKLAAQEAQQSRLPSETSIHSDHIPEHSHPGQNTAHLQPRSASRVTQGSDQNPDWISLEKAWRHIELLKEDVNYLKHEVDMLRAYIEGGSNEKNSPVSRKDT